MLTSGLPQSNKSFLSLKVDGRPSFNQVAQDGQTENELPPYFAAHLCFEFKNLDGFAV